MVRNKGHPRLGPLGEAFPENGTVAGSSLLSVGLTFAVALYVFASFRYLLLCWFVCLCGVVFACLVACLLGCLLVYLLVC